MNERDMEELGIDPPMKDVKWSGELDCNICGSDVRKVGAHFVDGRHMWGMWGLFCASCWFFNGCGKLGPGFGQKYSSKTLLKVEG